MMKSIQVFIPHNVLTKPSGLLLGWTDLASNTLCVLAVVSPKTCGVEDISRVSELAKLYASEDKNLKLLGQWLNGFENGFTEEHLEGIEFENLITIRKIDSGSIPHCELQGHLADDSGRSKPVIVIFDSSQILQSCPLMCLTNTYSITSKSPDHHSNAEVIVKALTTFWDVSMKLPKSCKNCTLFCDQSDFFPEMSTGSVAIYSSLPTSSRLPRLKGPPVSTILSTFIILCGQLWIRMPALFQRVFNILALGEQVQLKCHHISTAILETGTTPRDVLGCRNVLWRNLLDLILGVLFMVFLLQDGVTDKIAQSLMDWAEHVAGELSQLLTWLMGFPGGMKLNSQLDQLLGSFFLYHIYLWKGYLTILQPVFGTLLWYGSLSGCLGLSVQLSLMSDLLSMLTLHIYCFYAYAARLYSLQTYALASLGRLFQGKKRNVLRKRVDSTSYDVDQLFIGTLLFTILLFLLPTVGVYYIAFTALRLVVIIMTGCLGKMVSHINTLPVYSLIARFFHLAEMAGDIRVKVWPKYSGRPICLSLEVIQSPFSEVYNEYKDLNGHTTLGKESYTWGEFGKNLIIGNLIYPWISTRKR